MCSDPGCDSDAAPPVGEGWCPRRLDIELYRWFAGWPSMQDRKPLKNLLRETLDTLGIEGVESDSERNPLREGRGSQQRCESASKVVKFDLAKLKGPFET